MWDSERFTGIFKASSSRPNLQGFASDDRLVGTQGSNILHARGGDDFVNAKGGHDRILGQGGDDTLLGGSGHDTLIGGSGDDLLQGGSGNDIYRFTSGHDIIEDTRGNNTMSFEGFDVSEASLSQQGSNLVISLGESDSVTLTDYFDPIQPAFGMLAFGSDTLDTTDLIELLGG